MADYVLSANLELNDKFTYKIEGATKSSKSFKGIFRNVADSIIKQSSKIESAFSKVSTGISKVNSTALKVGSVIAGSLTAAGAGIGAFAIKGAADMEKYRNVLETVLKDEEEASKTMSFANKFANVTPFQNQEVIEGVVKLKSYGFDKEDIGYIGDMAAAMGKPLMQAVEAIADAKTGELERLKEFGITKDMIDEYSRKIGNTSIFNAKGQIKDFEALRIILKSMINDKLGGAMEKQSKTFYGAISTTIGTMKSTIIQIAGIGTDGKTVVGSMFDYIRKKAVGLSDRLVKMQEDGTIDRWAKKIGEEFSKLAPKIEEAWNSFKNNWNMDDTKNLFSGMATTLSLVGKAFGVMGKLSTDFFKDLERNGKIAIGVLAGVNFMQLAIRASLGDPTAIAGLGVMASIGGAWAGKKTFDWVQSLKEKTGVTISDMSLANDLGYIPDEMQEEIDIKRGKYDTSKLHNSVFRNEYTDPYKNILDYSFSNSKNNFNLNDGINKQTNINNNLENSDKSSSNKYDIKFSPVYNISGNLNKEEIKEVSYETFEKIIKELKLIELGER